MPPFVGRHTCDQQEGFDVVIGTRRELVAVVRGEGDLIRHLLRLVRLS